MGRFRDFISDYNGHKARVAEGVDDVRHKLIEEGWFGRQTTGNISDNSPAETEEAERPPHRHSDLYGEVWGKGVDAADLYGKGPAPAAAPSVEPPTIEPPTAPPPGPEPEV